MKVIGINLDIQWHDKELNFQYIENKVRNLDGDLFVLPEMFSTGFSMEPDEVADRNLESLDFLKKMANWKKAAFCASAPVYENGHFWNRMYFVHPDGRTENYDKRHLFSFSGEDKVYSAGDQRVIVSYRGIRILLQVCYDLRFPVFSRNQEDYDAIVYVANWPKKRVHHWEALLKARAIENQAYVFGVNRTGTDGNGLEYLSSSYFYFADGKEISTSEESVLSAELDKEALDNYREHYSFLGDRDRFTIEK